MVGGKTMNSFDFFVDLPRFDQAKCAEIEDKDLFFPDGRRQEVELLPQLKAICSSCIHEKECLEYALEKQISFGIWGGLTPPERDARADGKGVAFKGTALAIVRLHKKRKSVNEIANQLNTSTGYVRKVLYRLAATEQGAKPLHQQIQNSSKGLRSL
jgi:hypothetical protein